MIKIKCEFHMAQKSPDLPESTVIDAQYDFLGADGHWHYGCTGCWMQHRDSRQLGVGHAMHLESGRAPPPRPPGYVPPPRPVTALAVPTPVREPSRRLSNPNLPGGSPRAASPGGVTERKPRVVREKIWCDLEPTKKLADIKPSRPDAVLSLSIDLMQKQDGATLGELNALIGPKHDALTLLRWASDNKGYGFKADAAGRIRVVDLE